MLAKRIIATLLIKNGMLVKGKQFTSNRVVGSPVQAVKVFEARSIDEMVILDVEATREGRGLDFEFMKSLCDEAFMPLAIGGGIRTVEDIRGLLNAGADKVVIGTGAAMRPGLIMAAAKTFGSNAVVISVDIKQNQRGSRFVFVKSGTWQWIGGKLNSFLNYCQEDGAGEILLQSIDRDGMMTGYDLDLIRAVSGAVGIPVVASGGCGEYEDMALAIKAGADAVAAGALWQFSEATPLGAKKYLKSKGINVRF